MFGYFSNRFPQFFEHPGTFAFLEGLNDFHQLEVMKLYPEATVPHFESRVADDGNSMELIYTSPFLRCCCGYAQRSLRSLQRNN